MQHAKLFMNGQSQAVRLPKAFRFEGDTVIIKRQGKGVLLLPNDTDPWALAEQSLTEFSEDLVFEREQGTLEERPAIVMPHPSPTTRRQRPPR